MTSNHQLFGNKDERNLVVNVFINWMLTYLCDKNDLHKSGLQKDSSLKPDWFTKLQIEKLKRNFKIRFRTPRKIY